MNKKEFFDFLQFSYFPKKLTGINTNFRFFMNYNPNVMEFILKILPSLNESELSKIFFFYASNSSEFQEVFTYPEFMQSLVKAVKDKLDLINLQTLGNIIKSIGSISYVDQNVKLLFIELKNRLFLEPDLNGISNLLNAVTNLKCQDVITEHEKERLCTIFEDLYIASDSTRF